MLKIAVEPLRCVSNSSRRASLACQHLACDYAAKVLIEYYFTLYTKFVEHHVIKLILLKISKLSAHLTQAIIRDKLQRLKHTQDICTRQLITMFKCARATEM